MKKTKITENLNLEITRVQIVCNLYDDKGSAIGSPSQVVELDSEECAEIDFSVCQPLAGKFSAAPSTQE